MKRKGEIKRLIFLLLFLFFVGQNIFGVITATYIPTNYISFKTGDKISIPPATPAGTFSSDKLVAYLGTIKITREAGDIYYNPQMANLNGNNQFSVSGRVTRWGGGIQETDFHTYYHTSLSGPERLHLQRQNHTLHPDKKEMISANPFIVNLFIVSKHEASVYIEGETYTIVSGSLGSFNLKVSTSINPDVEEYISINGQTIPPSGPPADPIPLPEIGPGSPIPEIPYGDDPPPVMFNIRIEEESPFNLIHACSYTGVKVATTEVTVLNGVVGEEYAIQIKFTNPQNAPSFSLRPQGNPNGYAIPYKLRFGDTYNIKGGDLYDWEELSSGLNSKEIKVYDISETVASQAPAGIFEDTILVEIFSIN